MGAPAPREAEQGRIERKGGAKRRWVGVTAGERAQAAHQDQRQLQKRCHEPDAGMT